MDIVGDRQNAEITWFEVVRPTLPMPGWQLLCPGFLTCKVATMIPCMHIHTRIWSLTQCPVNT